MEHQKEKTKSNLSKWLNTSITARLLMVGFLTLILLIPLSYINSLIKERGDRQKDVVNEINSKWGKEVLLYGPILKIPYKSYKETTIYNEKSKKHKTEIETNIEYAFIFPEQLNVTSNVNSKKLKRGNFESAVYTSVMKLKGFFIEPNLTTKNILDKDILWNKATYIVKTSNLKGIKGETKINSNGKDYTFETNFNEQTRNTLDELESNYIKESDVPKTDEDKMSFDLNITFDGSELLQIIPIGKTTHLKMASNWGNPSFIGEFLPIDSSKKITQNSFDAEWKVTHLNRAFSQQYLNAIPDLKRYAFGAKFLIMVDEFQQSERSAKYGFLVIGLTFLLFFLIQTLSKINIHPFQYLMIGLALTMFYTLLVSISEHSNFLKAYTIAGSSVIILITLYSKSILNYWKFPILISLSLTALYIFIYTIIQLENYALLVGSIGLFIILAIVMYVSRKIEWTN
jgi:inner membrane protein